MTFGNLVGTLPPRALAMPLALVLLILMPLGCGSSDDPAEALGTTTSTDLDRDIHQSDLGGVGPDVTESEDVDAPADVPDEGEDPVDAGPEDTGPEDTGPEDTAPEDAGPEDIGEPDVAETEDAQEPDTADVIVPPPSGETCEDAFVVETLPFLGEGDTTFASVDYSYSDGVCPGEALGWGKAARDHVYRFQPNVSGVYTIDLAANFDSSLFIVTECDDIDDSCVAADEEPGSEDEQIVVSLNVNVNYFIIVDGWSNDVAFFAGTYALTVSEPCIPACGGAVCGSDGCGGICGQCAGGEICSNGACLEALTGCTPLDVVSCGTSVSGLATGGPGATNAFDGYTCAPDVGPALEIVHSLQLTTGATTRVTVSGENTGDLQVMVLDQDDASQCSQDSTCLATGSGSVVFDAAGDDTVYLVWDGVSPEPVEGFGFEISCCLPSCDGQTCGDDGCGGSCGQCDSGDTCVEGACTALPGTCIAASSLSCSDTAVGPVSNASAVSVKAFSSYACQAFAPDDYGNSPELVYSFSVDQDTTVTISDDGSPIDLAVLVDQGQGCVDSPSTCLAHTNSAATFSASAGKTYYLVWDAATPSGLVEAFSFGIECCVPDGCDGTWCGADGCGGTCGCNDDAICDGSVAETPTCVAAPSGDTCGAPFFPNAAEGFPLVIAGDTGAASDEYAGGPTHCPGLESAFGLGAADQVIEFTPEATAEFVLTLTSDFAATLAVLTTCDLEACVAGTDSGATTVLLTGGTTYYFVVDGASVGAAGTWSLEVGAPCVPDCSDAVCGSNACAGSCGTCAEGETCDEGQCFEALDECVAKGALTCDQVTVSVSNLGNGATAAFAGYPCAPFGSGNYATHTEAIYTLDTPTDAVVTISSQAPAGLDLVVLSGAPVDGVCDATGDSCLAGGTSSTTFAATGGSTYTVVFDGAQALPGGFEVSVDCCVPVECDGTVCGDNCGTTCPCELGAFCDAEAGMCGALGDTCAAPIPLVLGEPTAGNNDLGFSNTTSDAGCSGASGDGDMEPDVVYSFTPALPGEYLVSLVDYQSGQGPSLVWVTTDCENNLNGCTGAHDFLVEPEGFEVSLAAGLDYRVVVDSFSPGETGWFTLLVEGPL